MDLLNSPATLILLIQLIDNITIESGTGKVTLMDLIGGIDFVLNLYDNLNNDNDDGIWRFNK